MVGRERGSAIIELAMSFLLFFVLLFAVMEFGRLVASYNILAGATREGVRYAIVHGSASGAPASSDDIATVVKRWAVGLDRNAITVNTTWTPGKGPGSKVQVQARYAVVPLTGLIYGSSITIGSSSQMVISQ